MKIKIQRIERTGSSLTITLSEANADELVIILKEAGFEATNRGKGKEGTPTSVVITTAEAMDYLVNYPYIQILERT